MARITLAQMAERLDISPTTLRAQRAAGKIRGAVLVGKTWTVSEAEVERYRREHLGKAGRPKGHATAPRAERT